MVSAIANEHILKTCRSKVVQDTTLQLNTGVSSRFVPILTDLKEDLTFLLHEVLVDCLVVHHASYYLRVHTCDLSNIFSFIDNDECTS